MLADLLHKKGKLLNAEIIINYLKHNQFMVKE